MVGKNAIHCVLSSSIQLDRLSVKSILTTLHNQGIKSLMVEGGAQIISSFLAEHDAVDKLIVTVAPLWVGEAGVGLSIPSAIGVSPSHT
jgi:2,5-diamino-6-(ribosylamino)-4(3H)-pyrimidinone 5'-phosphate reductase